MGQVVLVRTETGTWRQPAVTAYQDEAELQQLVADSPDLLTGEPLATVSEFYIPGTGPVDIVGIAADGSLTVIECKLRANPEIRRAVVGQLLAYASGLWQMTYDAFAAVWETRAGISLLDHVRQKLGDDLDVDGLRSGIEANLDRGASPS